MSEAQVWYSPESEDDRFLPEGPRELVWNGREAVIWVNIQSRPESSTGSLLVRFWDTGEVQRIPVPGLPGFVIPTTQSGQLILGLTKAIGYYDLDQQTWSPLLGIPDENARTIINDGEPIPDSTSIVFGTKDTQFSEPLASLYLFHLFPQPRVIKLRGEQICSNGKVLHKTPDGLILYDIDTPSKTITRNRLDPQAGTLQLLDIAVDLRQEVDFPDGMIDGGDGTVIVAFYNPNPVPAGRAVRYRLSDGQALQSWTIPGSPRVTCPLLVRRPDGDKLIFTTAVEGMPPEQRALCPEAGSLFLAEA